MYQIYQWSDNNKLQRLDSYQYWNDEKKEEKKEWNIQDGNFGKLESYIETMGLDKDLRQALKISGICGKTRLTGIELGGGGCWSAPVLFEQLNDIKEMQFLEFSYHRIAKIAPLLLEHYRIPEDKVKLILGSFYEIKCPDETMDFVLLSQALHHAAEVERLLAEIYRVLKKDGVVIIIGEQKCGWKFVIYKMLERWRDIVFGNRHSNNIMLYKQSGCLSVDNVLGDRLYSFGSYRKMFRRNKFKFKKINTQRNGLGFVLWKQSEL